jgi:hypothetical protein
VKTTGSITDNVRWRAVEAALAHEQCRADEARVAEGQPPEPEIPAEPLPGKACR